MSRTLIIATTLLAPLALAACSGPPEDSADKGAASVAATDAAAPVASESAATSPAPSESAAASPSPSASASATPAPTPSATAKPVAAPTPAATVAAVAPPAVFARCAVCHATAKGAPDKIGPTLWGLYGTPAGKGSYAFSAGLKASGVTWNDASLDKWIENPRAMVPDTMMAFPGIKDPAKRAELIAYLKSLR